MDENHLLKILEGIAAGFRHIADQPQTSGLWSIARTLTQDVAALRDMISPPQEPPAPLPVTDPGPSGDSAPSGDASPAEPDPNAPQSEGGQQPG